MLDAGSQRGGFPLIHRLENHLELVQRVVIVFGFALEPLQDLSGSVRRTIIDDDDLLRQPDASNSPNRLFQRAGLIKDGNQDGEFHCSNSRFLSSRMKAERLASPLTASFTLF